MSLNILCVHYKVLGLEISNGRVRQNINKNVQVKSYVLVACTALHIIF